MKQYVNRDELAQMMGVSVRTISYWLAEGMPSETWGKRRRVFLPEQCMQWVRGRAHGAGNVELLNR